MKKRSKVITMIVVSVLVFFIVGGILGLSVKKHTEVKKGTATPVTIMRILFQMVDASLNNPNI